MEELPIDGATICVEVGQLMEELPVDRATICGEVGQLMEDSPLPDDCVRQAGISIKLRKRQLRLGYQII